MGLCGNAGYSVSLSCSTQMTVNLTAANPANVIANDALFGSGLFAGADFLYRNSSSTDASFPVYMAQAAQPAISTVIGIANPSGC